MARSCLGPWFLLWRLLLALAVLARRRDDHHTRCLTIRRAGVLAAVVDRDEVGFLT